MDNTLHHLIEQLGILRAEKKRHEYAAKQCEQQIRSKEHEIMDMMDDLEISESRSAAGKVALTESVYPQVENWDSFYQWILENQYLHFLEKRPAVLAYREALRQSISVPGVLPYTKRKVTFKEA